MTSQKPNTGDVDTLFGIIVKGVTFDQENIINSSKKFLATCKSQDTLREYVSENHTEKPE